jgi:hypothetical protein
MAKNILHNIATQATINTSIDIEVLINAFEEFFFKGTGVKYNPMGEELPKKPAKKLNNELTELGFDVISCSLEQTDYKIRIVTGYGELFNYIDITVDYWNGYVDV